MTSRTISIMSEGGRWRRVAEDWLVGVTGDYLVRRPLMLFFHGVEKTIQDADIQVLHISQDRFAGFLEQAKRTRVFLCLDEMLELLGRGRLPSNALVISFDDGYANNLHHAAPVLKALEIPAVFYLTTGAIGTEKFLPTTVARLAIRYSMARELPLPGGNVRLPLSGPHQRLTALEVVSTLLKTSSLKDVNRLVASLTELLDANRWQEVKQKFQSDRFLTWDEVRVLVSLGFDIGAHGHNHVPLHGNHEQADISMEISQSKRLIENLIAEVHHFAYPNGGPRDISAEAAREVWQAGFRSAATTFAAPLGARIHPLVIPRICAYDMRSIHRRTLRFIQQRAWRNLEVFSNSLYVGRSVK